MKAQEAHFSGETFGKLPDGDVKIILKLMIGKM
jgi:hypothetical protein